MSSGCGAPLTVPPSLLVAPQIEAARGATAVAAGRGQPRWLRQAGAAAGRRARAGCRMWPRQLTRWGGWHRGSGCSAERGRNQTGCYYVAACGSSRPTARAAAVVAVLCGMEWCLCHVEVALTNPNGASDGRTRFGPCGGRARAHRRKGGEGKRREAVGWVRMSMGGRGNGGWERGAPLGGEITLVAENGQATLRWGRRKRRREREGG